MLNRILEYRLKNDRCEVKIFVNGEKAIPWMENDSFDFFDNRHVYVFDEYGEIKFEVESIIDK